jgi:tetratricopeptide (TPR) repeat protein
MSADGMNDIANIEVRRLCALADASLARHLPREALQHLLAAWNELPQPRLQGQGAADILMAIGDCHLELDNDTEALRYFRQALDTPTGRDDAGLHLRLGMACYEMGLLDGADEEFACVEALLGDAGGEAEDPHYLKLLSSKLGSRRGSAVRAA